MVNMVRMVFPSAGENDPFSCTDWITMLTMQTM